MLARYAGIYKLSEQMSIEIRVSPEGKVSLAVRLTFQSLERTLTDAEVEAATTAVVELLATELGATRR